MARAKPAAKSSAYPAPQSMAEANDYIDAIGRAQRERARIETMMNDEIAACKARYSAQVAALDVELAERTAGVQAFAESRRLELTGGKVKFHRFPAGEIAWRLRPPSVSIRGKERIIAACKALGLTQFLRISEDLNKEAMLAEPDKAAAIDGVSVGSAGEDFIVKPSATDLEQLA